MSHGHEKSEATVPRVERQALEGIRQVPLQRAEPLEEAVVKELLAQLVPDVLDGVELWDVGRPV